MARQFARALALGAAGVFAVAAHAADMPGKAAPYAAPQWSGFYAGVNVGYAGQDPTVTLSGNDLVAAFLLNPTAPGTASGPISFGIGGVTGGVQIGYNWQFDPHWLIGLEADFSWTSIKGNGSASNAVSALVTQTLTAHQDIDWFGTIRARLGRLVSSDLLVFASGGLAYGHVDESVNMAVSAPLGITNNLDGSRINCGQSFGFGPAPVATCMFGSSSRIAVGWAAGAGAEYILTQHLSLKAEYLYVDLGGGDAFNVLFQGPTAPGTTSASYRASFSRLDFHTGRIGVNFRF